MDEQTQAQFVEWLKGKLQIDTDEQLNSAIQELGEEGLSQAFQTFQNERQQAQSVAVQTAKHGAKLDFIKSLKQYKNR